MKRLSLGIICLTTLIFTSCKNGGKSSNEQAVKDTTEMTDSVMNNDSVMNTKTQEAKKITVNLEPKNGSNVSGTVTFTEENGKVTMKATILGLSEGKHAIHLHENADCSAEDGSSAGGHWNPTNEKHGKWGSEHFHRGDIGNFEVNAEGKGTITFTTDLWCIGCDNEKKNIVGTAVIVHEGVDDFTSQPSGAAGNRVACAGVVKMK